MADEVTFDFTNGRNIKKDENNQPSVSSRHNFGKPKENTLDFNDGLKEELGMEKTRVVHLAKLFVQLVGEAMLEKILIDL